jgi:hypothetical protein
MMDGAGKKSRDSINAGPAAAQANEQCLRPLGTLSNSVIIFGPIVALPRTRSVPHSTYSTMSLDHLTFSIPSGGGGGDDDDDDESPPLMIRLHQASDCDANQGENETNTGK